MTSTFEFFDQDQRRSPVTEFKGPILYLDEKKENKM